MRCTPLPKTGYELTVFLLISYTFYSIIAWIYATISIIIVSMCGLFGVAIVPFTESKYYQDILRFLVAIAVGTLCGDALMVNLSIRYNCLDLQSNIPKKFKMSTTKTIF